MKIKIFLISLVLIQIFYIGNIRVNFKYEILKNSFSKDTGIKKIIPKKILEIKKILTVQKIKKFNLSEEFKKNTYLYERSIEFLYPFKYDNNEKKSFFLINEKIPDKCKNIINHKSITAAIC